MDSKRKVQKRKERFSYPLLKILENSYQYVIINLQNIFRGKKMANWCECKLELEGDADDIKKLLASAKDSKNLNDFSLEKLLPSPKNLVNNSEWCMDNWGTKYEIKATIEDANAEDYVSIRFDSAWNPPLEAFEKLSRLYPSLSFDLTCSEEANDYFSISKYKNGLQQEVKGSYEERFELNMEIDESSAKLDGDNIHVEIKMSYFDDPYDINGKQVINKAKLIIPIDIDEDDISNEYGESVILIVENDKHVNHEKEYDIVEFIKDNLEVIKTATEHNDLDINLPINEPTKGRKRKI